MQGQFSYQRHDAFRRSGKALRRLGPTKEVTAEYRKFEKKDAMKADKVEG